MTAPITGLKEKAKREQTMIASWRRARIRAGALGTLVGVALVIAACGSSSSSSTASSAAATRSAASSATGASAVPVTISTATGPDGTYLTGGSGRALYMWVGDDIGKSNCSGSCAMAWPPLTTSATPHASNGVTAADLGTITRSDGSKQVTYKGHPLYYFAVDTGPGTTKGQGSDSFGAKWWLVAPSGAAITGGGPSVSPPSGY
jgi:predicted lipoprotein with Yx(FWY)xxD motif